MLHHKSNPLEHILASKQRAIQPRTKYGCGKAVRDMESWQAIYHQILLRAGYAYDWQRFRMHLGLHQAWSKMDCQGYTAF